MKPLHRARPWHVAVTILLALSTVAVVAAAKLSQTGTSNTTFKVSTSSQSFSGKAADMTTADDGTTVTITVKLGTLSTGVPLRDEKTKAALEVDKYPTVVLRVARSALKFPGAGDQVDTNARGQLTLHGQTKALTFQYTAELNSGAYDISGEMTINLNDFGLKPPSYLGQMVKPDVVIQTKFQVRD